MAQDRWFRLVDDKMDDIPSRIQSLKSSYTQRIIIFIIFIVVGTLLMSLASDNPTIAIGGFLSVIGIAGLMAFSIMAHAQLCLYRGIIEIRRQMEYINNHSKN